MDNRTPAHDAGAHVAADSVRELRGLPDIPQREVGALARVERSPIGESPSARAACRVTPASASSGVSRNSVQAKFSISTSEPTGEVPGLQSVAIAIGTRSARSAAIGGTRVSRSTWKAPGSSTATVPARAIAATPASFEYSR